MKSTILKAALTAFAIMAVSTASADFGVGVKAGTLGLGVEGRWSPLPYLDFRAGVNTYDYDDDGSHAGIDWDATLALDSYYATGNLRFPLSPFRITAGAFSNSNEFQMTSQDTGGQDLEIGGVPFSPADAGTLQGLASFDDVAPYVGVGFDFEVLGKVGLNFDLGVLWQGEPGVALTADGLAAGDPSFEAALEAQRLELEDDLSDFKAWPVLSVSFIYNF